MGLLAVSAWDCMMQSRPLIGHQAQYWPLIGRALSLVTRMAMNLVNFNKIHVYIDL